ncbi:hypothetical protein FS749_007959 [Ceratobasidium sp. UAMH 11750]|nr:hypothetical protein FS749_007959 [Ceratobasidium sp. UAMH 11750]
MSTSGMDLQALSKGFSKTQKLAITLEPAERGYSNGELHHWINTQADYVQRVGPIFQSVREFCFLLPGMWPHEQFGAGPPYSVDTLGFSDDKDFSVPVELLKVMPELVHVDTVHRCYSRVGAGVKHPGYGYRQAPLGGCDPVKVIGPEIGKGVWHGDMLFLDTRTSSKDAVWFGRPRSECRLSDDWRQLQGFGEIL